MSYKSADQDPVCECSNYLSKRSNSNALQCLKIQMKNWKLLFIDSSALFVEVIRVKGCPVKHCETLFSYWVGEPGYWQLNSSAMFIRNNNQRSQESCAMKHHHIDIRLFCFVLHNCCEPILQICAFAMKHLHIVIRLFCFAVHNCCIYQLVHAEVGNYVHLCVFAMKHQMCNEMSSHPQAAGALFKRSNQDS